MTAVKDEGELVDEVVVSGGGRMVRCAAPGCGREFKKRSGRHIYCKGPGCTYRRGAPAEPELVAEGAAAEVLRRLHDAEQPEVGPSLFSERVKAVAPAIKARDALAASGALVDLAVASVWWADQIAEVGIAEALAQRAQQQAPQGSGRAVGLVHAVMSSHMRTHALAERRVEAIYAMLRAKELMDSAAYGVQQTSGGLGEETAREAHGQARKSYEAAERALQSIEAAWQERTAAVRELSASAATLVEAQPRNGGTGARAGAAAVPA